MVHSEVSFLVVMKESIFLMYMGALLDCTWWVWADRRIACRILINIPHSGLVQLTVIGCHETRAIPSMSYHFFVIKSPTSGLFTFFTDG